MNTLHPVFVVLLVTGCSRPASSEVTTPPPAATATATSPDSSKPPNGTWNVAKSETVNTCVAPDAGPGALGGGGGTLGGHGKARAPTSPILVPLHHPKDGGTIATFALPPSPWLGMRYDVRMEVGKVAESKSRPDKSCAYEVKRETELTEATKDRMVLRIRTDYGDTTGCGKGMGPGQCKVETVLTYTLAEKLCESHCEVTGAKLTLEGGMDTSGATCVCPDGGL